MLMLTRQIGQSVMIGDNIRVNVVEIKYKHSDDPNEDKSYVRLGFEAPKEVKIDRNEVYLQKQAEKDDTD